MKTKLFSIIALLTLAFYGCQTDATTTDANVQENEELAKLKSEKRALEEQLAEKDSVINESIMLFNEIEENLAMINLKEDEIRYKSQDVELNEDGKQYILQEIQNINYLREANEKKVNQLNKQLKESNNKVTELEKMVNSLMAKIESQNEEIDMLRAELEDLDREYVELLEAYQEQSTLAFETMKELNRVFYAYGTEKELEAAGVIVRVGGFIGMGKKPELKGDFNDEYFTEIDMMQQKTIDVEGGKEYRIITDHPSASYEVVTNGTQHQIKIKDPKNFWKVSKYLVVIVE